MLSGVTDPLFVLKRIDDNGNGAGGGDKVKRPNKFETPGDKKTPIVSMVKDSDVTAPRRSCLPSFA
jgi:hypothetical protein